MFSNNLENNAFCCLVKTEPDVKTEKLNHSLIFKKISYFSLIKLDKDPAPSKLVEGVHVKGVNRLATKGGRILLITDKKN